MRFVCLSFISFSILSYTKIISCVNAFIILLVLFYFFSLTKSIYYMLYLCECPNNLCKYFMNDEILFCPISHYPFYRIKLVATSYCWYHGQIWYAPKSAVQIVRRIWVTYLKMVQLLPGKDIALTQQPWTLWKRNRRAEIMNYKLIY